MDSSVKKIVLFNSSVFLSDKQISKLFGIGFGYHYLNSAQFGWKLTGSKIELFSYSYVYGILRIHELGLYEINRPIDLELKIFKDQVLFFVNSKLKHTEIWIYRIPLRFFSYSI